MGNWGSFRWASQVQLNISSWVIRSSMLRLNRSRPTAMVATPAHRPTSRLIRATPTKVTRVFGPMLIGSPPSVGTGGLECHVGLLHGGLNQTLEALLLLLRAGLAELDLETPHPALCLVHDSTVLVLRRGLGVRILELLHLRLGQLDLVELLVEVGLGLA